MEQTLEGLYFYDVDPDTIGQYIGQKDKNGEEIYEGDVLEYIFRNIDGKETNRWHYIVRECTNGWELRSIEQPRSHNSLKFCYRYEITGNIHDNPELLGGWR